MALKVLDLFCGAGGTSRGFHDAGFDVTGVDINPQPNYPYKFIRADCMKYSPGVDFLHHAWNHEKYDLVWASPPCQRYSVATKRFGRSLDHPDLIDATRAKLLKLGVPFVIENVPQAPLRKDLTLCGFMFPDLKVIRHRVFELHGFTVDQPQHQLHLGTRGIDYFSVAGHPGGYSSRDKCFIGSIKQWQEAMQIDWMTPRELVESIPPAYSKYIAQGFMQTLLGGTKAKQ